MRNRIPSSVKRFVNYSFENEFKKESFSQFGEDLIIENLTRQIKQGFFIDVGAYHPIKFSNTYLLYKKGWRGINIEPRPGSKKLFDQYRPEDKNLELGISRSGGEKDYFVFNEGLQNTFKEEFISKADPILNPQQATQKIMTWPLSKVVHEYDFIIAEFNILLIDTEGSDLEVLESNDWDFYKPQLILIEDLSFTFQDAGKSKIWKFVSKLGYELIYHGINSSVYRRLSLT